jgi:hypothetical protein
MYVNYQRCLPGTAVDLATHKLPSLTQPSLQHSRLRGPGSGCDAARDYGDISSTV